MTEEQLPINPYPEWHGMATAWEQGRDAERAAAQAVLTGRVVELTKVDMGRATEVLNAASDSLSRVYRQAYPPRPVSDEIEPAGGPCTDCGRGDSWVLVGGNQWTGERGRWTCRVGTGCNVAPGEKREVVPSGWEPLSVREARRKIAEWEARELST